MFNSIIIHYGEIGIKGKDRSFFEKKLVDNLRWSLKNSDIISVKRISGRIIIEIDKSTKLAEIKEKLANVFGIAHFSFAIRTNLDLEDIKKISLELTQDKKSFKVKTVRSNKSFQHSSSDVNNIIGEVIVKSKKLKVNLDNPEQTIFIEITDKDAFVYNEKIKSLGGLPVGVSGKIISLISGGIDSPVSSYLMMKRGCSVIFVHFFNSTINTKQSLEKVISLVDVLSKYQFKTKLYLVPFENIQKEIIKFVNSKYRMIVYKRYMLKSSDKEETIQIAKRIKTFDISILPYQDCCSFLISEHPATKSNLKEIESFELQLNEKELIEEAVKKAQTKQKLN